MNALKKSLKIQYLSDIHTEFVGAHGIEAAIMRIVPKAPVLVLAGDIGVIGSDEYAHFLTTVSQKFDHTFFIHGNHEYYRGTAIGIKYKNAVAFSKKLETPRLHFLHNSTYDLDNRWRFIGTTLWSHIESREHLINDFEAIPWMFPEYYNYLHKKSRTFVQNATKKAVEDNKIPIVITHHLPSYRLVAPKYRAYSKFNQCFASHSDDLIDVSIAAWIYGHTHTPSETVWSNGKTQVVCNPVGYPGERTDVDYGKTIDVVVDNDER